MASFYAGGIVEQVAVTATAAGTTTLTVTSKQIQVFTGSSTQTVVLPSATTMLIGQKFEIYNQSSGTLTLQFNGGSAFTDASGTSYSAISAHTVLVVKLQTNGTSAGTWTAISVLPGGGANTPTVQKFTSGSGTYTTPANVSFIEVIMVGGGGGGASGDSTFNSGHNGNAGNNTTFGTSLLTANGGSGGTQNASPASGGSATGGDINITGGAGGGATSVTAPGGGGGSGGSGGSSALGGGANGTGSGQSGEAAGLNSGGGGSGGGAPGSNTIGGGGGGAGGYLTKIIAAPSVTYSYSVGSGGTGNTSGSTSGGNGAAGIIEVKEYYFNGAVGTATNVTGVVAVANGGTGLSSSVNGRYFSSTSTISGSLSTVTYATKGFDSQNAYSGGVWTCQTAGKYQFNAGIATAGTVALNSALDLQIQQSGSASQISEDLVDGAAGLTNLSTSVGDIFNCAVNDTITVKVSSGATTPTIVSSNSRNYFSWTWLGT